MEERKYHKKITTVFAYSKWRVVALDNKKVLIKSCIIIIIKKAVTIIKITSKDTKIACLTIVK